MTNRVISRHDPVAVIIVNWNAGKWLERCVRAVYGQTLVPSEVILVDNGSSDGSTAAVVAQFASLRVVETGTNLGFAAANNLAVRGVSPECVWIVLLNPDAFPEPCWLESLLTAAQRSPQYAVFGSRLMTAEHPSIVDGSGDVYHISGLVWRAGHGRKIDLSGIQSREIFSPCAAAAMYRKDVFLQAGGFDEDFFCYVEDVDLGFRLRLLGYRCWYVAESVAYHVGSAVTGRHSHFSIYHGHRNLVWTFFKNMPGALFWVLLPLHLALNVASVFYFSLRGQAGLILRAKRDSLNGIPAMWHKRRRIQAERTATLADIWRSLDKRVIPPGRSRSRAGKN
ncbi:MAG: glycosyltransferase family 2 protein [Gammaproteobacteria bacterium]